MSSPIPECSLIMECYGTTAYLCIGVIPKASSRGRIEENCRLFDFDLAGADLAHLESGFSSLHRYCWDPTFVV